MNRRQLGSRNKDRGNKRTTPSKEPENPSKKEDYQDSVPTPKEEKKPVSKINSKSSFGLSPRDPANPMNGIKPDDWNNIAIPVVDAVKILMGEIDKI